MLRAKSKAWRERELEIEDILQNAEIIKSNGSSQALAWVVQSNCNAQKELYLTRWFAEADPLADDPDQSPIGKELICKENGISCVSNQNAKSLKLPTLLSRYSNFMDLHMLL